MRKSLQGAIELTEIHREIFEVFFSSYKIRFNVRLHHFSMYGNYSLLDAPKTW
jgi:hypothetical protein